jgi:chemotaxis protein MotB
MKGMEPEKPPNHERWIISYADFVTLLLATFVVMYAVSTINSSKFQQMAEAFSTAFIGRTTHVQDTGFAAANKAPFTSMPSPVHVPIVTREQQMKNLPPDLIQQPMSGNPTENLAQSAFQEDQNSSPTQLQQKIEQRLQGLDSAYNQLSKALAPMISKGQVHVSLQSLGVVIDINEVLLFNSGKADLTPSALPLIDQIAKILADLHYQIQVNGFTDDVPIHNAQFDSNWDLSANRAISVVKRIAAAGIDPTLLVGAGFGQYHPVGPNNSPQGKAANRRVSIVVVSPLQGSDPAKTQMLGSAAGREGPSPSPAATAPTTPAAAAPAAAVPAAGAAPAPAAAAPEAATPPPLATPSR